MWFYVIFVFFIFIWALLLCSACRDDVNKEDETIYDEIISKLGWIADEDGIQQEGLLPEGNVYVTEDGVYLIITAGDGGPNLEIDVLLRAES